jgi:LysM repeat protein
VWLVLLTSLLLAGCGRLLMPPTSTPVAVVPPTQTNTPTPTVTRQSSTATPAPATPFDTATPTLTPTPIIYVIKKGDLLGAIAKEYGVSVEAIQEVNGISDPRRLRIDQEIIIPPPKVTGDPTPLPTPTPLPLQIGPLTFHWTPVGTLLALGEVLNLSSQPAEEVQVLVSLHDEQGTLLSSGAAYTQLDILAGDGRAPFAILYDNPPDSFAQYQARIISGVPSSHLGPRYPDLVVADERGALLDDGNYQVTGQVRNIGQADAEKVALVVTLYDAEGRLTGVRTVEISADHFLTGAVAPFEVTLTPMGPVSRFDVQIQGWWIGYEIPPPTATPEATP